jgi:hypothetical protein
MTLIGQDAGWEKTEKRKNTANKEKRKPTLACAWTKKKPGNLLISH